MSLGWQAAATMRRLFLIWMIPWGNRPCVACGECVQACPTGALMPARCARSMPNKRAIAMTMIVEVQSVCLLLCGVGCQLSFKIKDEKIKFVEGVNGLQRLKTASDALKVGSALIMCTMSHRLNCAMDASGREDAPVKGSEC